MPRQTLTPWICHLGCFLFNSIVGVLDQTQLHCWQNNRLFNKSQCGSTTGLCGSAHSITPRALLPKLQLCPSHPTVQKLTFCSSLSAQAERTNLPRRSRYYSCMAACVLIHAKGRDYFVILSINFIAELSPQKVFSFTVST